LQLYYLVQNPSAGRGRVPDATSRVERFFAAHGLPLTVLPATSREESAQRLAALPPDARILSLGGDGTLNGVLQSSVNTERVVGILPTGSADDFSFALGLDRFDLDAALEVVRAGSIRRVDTGLVNGIHFINAFGSGFDADVNAQREAFPRWVKGTGAYLLSVFVTLARLRNVPVSVQVDGCTVHEGPALLVSVQNGPRTGGSFLFSPEASVDDGLFDVVVAGRLSRLGTVQVLPRVFNGSHLLDPRVGLFRGSRVRVEWLQARRAHLEGEVQPLSSVFEAQLLPRSLKVFAPASVS
jgi:diacylglycerol kinase (ATP)